MISPESFTWTDDPYDDLADKVQFLIDYMEKAGYLDEHAFMFPDGDLWYATGYYPPEEQKEPDCGA